MEVKDFIEVESKSDCVLLSEEYEKSKKPLLLKCACGNRFSTSWNNFKYSNKRRCDECGTKNKKIKMKLKKKNRYNYEYVKRFVDKQGYILLSTSYNPKEKIRVICPEGHEYQVKFYNFHYGDRCRKCKDKEIAIKNTHTYEYVKEYIESFNYQLVSTRYIGNHEKLQMRCPSNHSFKMSFDGFKNQEQRCPICDINSRSGENHWNWQGGISPFRSIDMLSSRYKNWRLKVLRRDYFTCQICGSKNNGSLEVHHLESYSDNPDLRYSLSNGITLCQYCHNSKFKGSFHNIYGTQNINTEKFIEYLNRRLDGEFDEMILCYEGGDERIVGRKEEKTFEFSLE